MIQVEKLKKVKKIIAHKYCHDGTSSAMIIKDVLHDADVEFYSHKDKAYLDLEAQEGMLFCDISPPPGRDQEFIDTKAIVLDHHEKTKDTVLKFQEHGLGVYGETQDGISGAVLAYNHVWLPLIDLARTDKIHVCRLQRLAGIRDTYQKDSIEWDDAQEQTEAIAFYPINHFLNNHIAGITAEENVIGRIIKEKTEDFIKRAAETAYTYFWKDRKIAILSGHRVISDASEELRKQGCSIVFSFTYKNTTDGLFLSYSSRSDGSFDCNKFAGYFGGGGHIRAAGGIGFEVNSNTLNPYSVIRKAVSKYGSRCLL